MLLLLSTLQSLGWLLYAGPMLAFAVMVFTNKNTISCFTHWGVGFGLSLTLWIYTTIALQYLNQGNFEPILSKNMWIPLAICMWISNIKLEIWTLDPIRKKNDKTAEEQEIAIRSLQMHLVVHSMLILSVHTLQCVSV